MLFIGVAWMITGVFDLLDPDGIVRSIVYVFGDSIGRGLIICIGLMCMYLSLQMFKLVKTSMEA